MTAYLGAIGEAVERYSAARVDRCRVLMAPAAKLQGASFEPTDLCLYDVEQYDRDGFPYFPYDRERPLHWISGRLLVDGEPVWVPAQMAYFSDEIGPETRLCQVTSNGLAAGADYEDAAVRAICELVERDAVMMTWLAKLPVSAIPLDLVEPSSEVDGVLRVLEAAGASLELYALDAGMGIPCVLSLCTGGERADWPAVTVASAANLCPQSAIRSAVLENGYSGRSIRDLAKDPQRRRPARAEDIQCFMDHALYYADPDRLGALAFIRDTRRRLDRASLKQESAALTLDSYRRALAEAGCEIALIDVTSPDVAPFGFSVVRALGPGLQPLHCGYGMERRANPRLKSRTDNLNPDPHPLC